jgi:hypothetical protein
LIAAGFAYVLYAVVIISLLRHTTVHGDFWIIYERLLQIPFPGNVLAPENAHSMVLPNLIWLANLYAFRGDETPLYGIALALLASVAALLLRAVFRDRRIEGAERSLLTASALAATFWLAKLQTLISAGFTIIYALPVLGLLLGVLGLTSSEGPGSRRAVRWGGAWGGALLATFSFGTGLAAWPALGWIAWARRAPGRALAIWGLGMATCAVLILMVLPRFVPEGDEGLPTLLLAPWESLKNWLQLIGSPVANTWAGIVRARESNPTLGLLSGMAGVVLAAWGLRRARRNSRDLTQVEWTGVALVLFGAGAAGMIAIARTNLFRYFSQNVFASHYLWWTACFWLGLIWLLARAGGLAPALRAPVHLILAAACLAGAWPAHTRVARQYQHERAESESIAASLAAGVPMPSFSLPLFIEHERIFRLDAALRRERLSYYARDGYRSVGDPLEKWFSPRPETESAQMRPDEIFSSILRPIQGMKISGWLTGRPADLILLTDEKRVVRGLGTFAPAWQPFSAVEGSFFTAFAPVPEPGESHQIWAVRGRECRRVVAAGRSGPTAGPGARLSPR